MKKIFKYPLSKEDVTKIQLPVGVEILHVGLDPKGVPCLWAEIPNPDYLDIQPLDTRIYDIFGTGWEIPDPSHYIGTYHHGEYVWHVYEVAPRHFAPRG